MAKHELESVELTNMCAIIDSKTQQVLVQERIKSWAGVTFPGGHVELGEAVVPSTIREIKEETGLTIKNLKLCGIKDWYEPDKKRRYIVFLYRTKEFSGQLLNESETEEGKVYWLPIAQLPQQKLAPDFAEMAEMMLQEESYSEFWYELDGSNKDADWLKKFY